MEDFERLLNIAKRKTHFDVGNDWSNGSATYLAEIKKEVDEVIEEIPKSRLCYLEDELGDVLWDYLNILTALEKEVGSYKTLEKCGFIREGCQKNYYKLSPDSGGAQRFDDKLYYGLTLSQYLDLRSGNDQDDI